MGEDYGTLEKAHQLSEAEFSQMEAESNTRLSLRWLKRRINDTTQGGFDTAFGRGKATYKLHYYLSGCL